MIQLIQEKTNLKQLINQLNIPPEYEKQASWWAETSIIRVIQYSYFHNKMSNHDNMEPEKCLRIQEHLLFWQIIRAWFLALFFPLLTSTSIRYMFSS